MKNKGSNLSFLSMNLLPLLCPLGPHGLADKGNILITKLKINMITNNILTRKMGEFDVHQRTMDGFFDAGSLLQQWNSFLPKDSRIKYVSEFLKMKKTEEFIEEIVRREEKSPSRKDGVGDYKAVVISKGKNTKSGRTPDRVWMHPYLFIDFAMWLNPAFKYEVIKFVHDNLVNFRNRAGDAYRELSAAVYNIIPKNIFRDKIQALAQSLNIIVYGKHETMARNLHGEEKLAEELMNLETDLARMINMGYIRNEEGIRDYLYRVLKMKKQVYF